MKNAQFWRSRAVRHGVVWLLIISLFLLFAQHDGPEHLTTTGLRYAALMLAVHAAAIYTHYWLLANLLERRRYLGYAVATLALLVAGGAVFALVIETDRLNLVKLQVGTGGGPHTGTWLRLAQGAANVLLTLILATVARYVRRGIVSHLQVQQLRALQLETELSLLKAQVNQHFLFNTLNNLYGLSLAAPEQMPEALLQLAGLMRYQLDSSRQATVTVGTEAEYLANYIGLEKLRLRANTQVEFTADLPHPEQPLAPLLLLPLVENCFKHAIGPGAAHRRNPEADGKPAAGQPVHSRSKVLPRAPAQHRAPQRQRAAGGRARAARGQHLPAGGAAAPEVARVAVRVSVRTM